MEAHAHELVRGLLEAGYDVDTYVGRPDERGTAAVRVASDRAFATELSGWELVDAATLAARSNLARTVFFVGHPGWLPTVAFLGLSNRDVRILVRSGGNDLLAGWSFPTRPGLTKRLLNRGAALALPGRRTLARGDRRSRRRWMVGLVERFAERVIVNSDFSRRRLEAIGVAPDRMVVVRGGVRCERFTALGDVDRPAATVLSVGRLVRFKGVDVSLRAFAEAIRNVQRPLRYDIVGDGPERPRLERMASELGVADSVRFLGAVPFADMPQRYRAADVVLHLAREQRVTDRDLTYVHTETMGRALCEAAAAGVPVVASNVGGIPEIVRDGDTGLLVPEGNATAAAERLATLLGDRTKRRAMGFEARRHAEASLGWRRVHDAYRAIIDAPT